MGKYFSNTLYSNCTPHIVLNDLSLIWPLPTFLVSDQTNKNYFLGTQNALHKMFSLTSASHDLSLIWPLPTFSVSDQTNKNDFLGTQIALHKMFSLTSASHDLSLIWPQLRNIWCYTLMTSVNNFNIFDRLLFKDMIESSIFLSQPFIPWRWQKWS